MEEDVAVKDNIEISGVKKVMIEVEDERFTMNRYLLVSNSEYFRSMFLGSFVEKHLDVVRIEIIRKEDFRLFVDFIERLEFRWQDLNSNNLLRILDSATMLRLNGFVDACEDHLLEKWENYGNASEMYSLSISYEMEKLTWHLLRLLAQCMDIGFQISMGELFNDINMEHCVYLTEVSYEYLLRCLRNSSTETGFGLGPPPKEFLPKVRDNSESRALFEWVLRWIFNAAEDDPYALELQQIETLIVLCDIEFLSIPAIEETLRQAVVASNIDEECATIGTVKSVFEYLIKKSKDSLDNLDLGMFFTGSKKNDMIPAFRLRSSTAKRCWTVEELTIPINDYDFKVLGTYDSSVYFYRPTLKEFWSYHLETKEFTRLANWQEYFYCISVTVSKDHLFCSCDRRWGYHWYEDGEEGNLPPCLFTFDFKADSWSRSYINLRKSYWYCYSNLVYFNGYVYYVVMDKDGDIEANLVRYEVAKKVLREKRVSIDTTGLENCYNNELKLTFCQGVLILFLKDIIVVIDPATFDDETIETKLIDFQMNEWKLLDIKVRDDVVLIITYPPDGVVSKFDVRRIHISKMFPKEEFKLVPVGFLDRTNVAKLKVPVRSKLENKSFVFL